jgi:hypothetical protein
MPGLAELLFAYGLAFGAMNKLPDGLYSRLPKVLWRLLSCAYCTGFHTGWVVYLIAGPDAGWQAVPAWAFASAAFSYVADAGMQAVEQRAG